MSRRQMLKSAACGFGYLALADLCARTYGAETPPAAAASAEHRTIIRARSLPKPPHFPAKAKRVIFLFMQGRRRTSTRSTTSPS